MPPSFPTRRPSDLMKDVETCVRMRRDMYRTSFGTEAGFDEGMGPGNAHYIEQLRSRILQVPEGNAHLWRDDRIVGQLEMRLLEDERDVIRSEGPTSELQSPMRIS